MTIRALRFTTLGVCLALVSAAAVAADRSPTMLGVIEAFDSAAVGDSSVAVSGMRLSAGRVALALDSGEAVVVRGGSDPIGIYFRGRGSLEYRSADPVEFPVVTYNLKKSSSIDAQRTGDELVVREPFTEVLWLASGHPLPKVEGKPSGSLRDAFDRHRARSTKVRGAPASHAFAAGRLDAPGAALVRATIFGGREDFLYVLDSLDRRSESLAFLRKSSGRSPDPQSWWRLMISDQPVGRDRRDPPIPRYLLTDVDLALVASGGRDASLSVTETIVPQGDAQSLFRFDLYSTVWDFIGRGLVERVFRVKTVTDSSGRKLAWHHQNDELAVETAEPVPPGREAKLKFEIEGDFLVRPAGDSYWMLGVEPWFPQPDFGGQFYTLHTRLRVKKPFVPFAPGVTVSRRSEGDENVLETRVEQPVQFAIVLAGRYEFEEETRNGVTIRVASYAMKNRRAFKQLASLAFGIIEYYENFLGPFPFPEFNILEINSFGFGQAPPGIMFITKEAFNPLGGEPVFESGVTLNQVFSQGANHRFAHEIAHEYWAHVVKMPSEEEQWLTEAFAEYSSALFLKAFKGKSTYDAMVSRWRARASDATGAAPIPLANRVYHADFRTRFLMRSGLLYDKGALLLAALHKELGDQVFLTFLKSFQKSFRWKFGSTRHVVGLLQFVAKKDYGPFFEANFWGTGMPAR